MDKFKPPQGVHYLREQIYSATSILARHQPKPGGYCTCLRSLPCSQATAARQRLDHYEHQLALGDVAAEQPAPYTHWLHTAA